ncbi:acyl-CoA thioesterase [Hirschia litorea]|uniref:Acyl-CoA thioesterase n=1 Tax=Hirschia litorea TaxID=1199156 RepID=A0ABW2IKJ6_9PROT
MSNPKYDFQVMWGDMDANAHLANTGYLDYASQCRMLYLGEGGFGHKEALKLGVGSVALHDNISYRKELHMLEKFSVDFQCGGINSKKSRYIFVNRFYGEDGELRAEVRSMIVWMDLKLRKSTIPPQFIIDRLEALPRTEDYQEL